MQLGMDVNKLCGGVAQVQAVVCYNGGFEVRSWRSDVFELARYS
jgi:hypothetical protein